MTEKSDSDKERKEKQKIIPKPVGTAKGTDEIIKADINDNTE